MPMLHMGFNLELLYEFRDALTIYKHTACKAPCSSPFFANGSRTKGTQI
jgi:hypothetical protein